MNTRTVNGMPVKVAPNAETVSDQAYTAIVDLILSHQLRPGERTSVIQLAERLAMGRTPVKEAITRLQAEGLLSVAGRSGTTVNSIDEDTARQIFALRRNLETFAVSDAVKNAKAEDIKLLRNLLSELSKSSVSSRNFAEDALRFVSANVKFHALIVGSAGNPTLDRLYGQIQLQAQIVTYLFHRGVNPDSFKHRQDEHVAIVDALEERDAARLKNCWRVMRKLQSAVYWRRCQILRVQAQNVFSASGLHQMIMYPRKSQSQRKPGNPNRLLSGLWPY